MTNIPKELQQKIEREAEEYNAEQLDCGEHNLRHCDGHDQAYIKGALSVAEQLVKAVEALKVYANLGWSTEYAYRDGTYCFNVITQEKVTTAANEFLKEHERWLNENNQS